MYIVHIFLYISKLISICTIRNLCTKIFVHFDLFWLNLLYNVQVLTLMQHESCTLYTIFLYIFYRYGFSHIECIFNIFTSLDRIRFCDHISKRCVRRTRSPLASSSCQKLVYMYRKLLTPGNAAADAQLPSRSPLHQNRCFFWIGSDPAKVSTKLDLHKAWIIFVVFHTRR